MKKPTEAAPASIDRLLRTSEAARLLSISQANLRRRIQEGQIPAVRLSRTELRVKQSDLETFISSIAPAR